MKRLATILPVILVLALLAPSAFAVDGPIPGTYKTLTGTIQPGKATESMPADLAEGQLGNMIWAESWNGSVLGSNWKVMCAQIASSPQLVFDNVDGNGNGQRAYRTDYTGGLLWLDGNGAWYNAASPAAAYSAAISSFSITVYKQIVGGQPSGAVSNIAISGDIEGYASCFTLAISNAELAGYTPLGYPPALGPFPLFRGPSDCSTVGNHGTYWNVHDVTLNIIGQCSTPTRSSTWGRIKTLYR
jgi:hypothetical protein